MVTCHNSYFRTPSPHPSPLWGEGAVCRRPRFTRMQRVLIRCRCSPRCAHSARASLSPGGERDGVRGLGRFRFSTTTLAVTVAILAPNAHAELVAYKINGDAIPASLTGGQGDAARGRAIVANHNTGLCLLCHSGPFPEDKFQGTMAPDLAGAGARWSEGQLRLRIVDASKFNPANHHAAVLSHRSSDPGGSSLSRQAGAQCGGSRGCGCLSDDLEVK